MTIFELYINNRLCDLGGDFGVRLNRQLIKPGELTAKDAQYSYSITLPRTQTNDENFGYAGVEETRGKFNRNDTARLVANGIQVFTGYFRMSEITDKQYKGNLYVPTVKSLKDVFEDKSMNQIPDYRIPFGTFTDAVNKYNTDAGVTPQPAIFPYVLYGVLPKSPADLSYTEDKNVWDDSVRIGMQDLPPSPNLMMLVKHIFNSCDYQIGGFAFNDERLTKLYMSYKNDPDYVQPWNYGRHAYIHIGGVWASSVNKRTGVKAHDSGVGFEKGVYEGRYYDSPVFGCDLLNSTNVRINSPEDPGKNVLSREVQDASDPYNRIWSENQITIPVSGLYKIRLNASIKLLDDGVWRNTDAATGVQHVCKHTDGADNRFEEKMYEVRLVRDWGKGDFGISSPKIDGTFYRDNLQQTTRMKEDAGFDLSIDTPKYFPQGQQLLIDAAQDPNIVCGFAFGVRTTGEYKNPLDVSNKLAQIQVAKPARSWMADVEDYTRLAINNPGYKAYGVNPGRPDDQLTDDASIGYYDSDRFRIELRGAPGNSATRGKYAGAGIDAGIGGEGVVNAVVWLQANERITLVSVSEGGEYRNGNMHSVKGWTEQEVTFDLVVEPFRTDADWLKVNEAGASTETMNWEDPANFDRNNINLAGFLPADMKVNDFIDNVCKAFNLQLTQTGDKAYELNVKRSAAAESNLYINLDNLASVKDRVNTPLGLPSIYKLGFTIDQGEEGYNDSKDGGGGEFTTGVTEEKIVEQKSSFSYNWFKRITKQQGGGSVVLPLPVISKREAWAEAYPAANDKRYTGQPLRFWYYDGLLNDLGATFDFGNSQLRIAKVSNELPGLCILNYKNQEFTLLSNYFTLQLNGDGHYTEIEGHLTPDQYQAFDGLVKAMFNGDLYRVAEITGYDPSAHNKTKIKLIK